MIVYFDIETVARRFTPGHREIALAKAKAKTPEYPTYKPETRERKQAEYVDTYVKNKENNMSLQPFSAQVVSICAQTEGEPFAMTSPYEDFLLVEFNNWIYGLEAGMDLMFCGFNNRQFDMPVLAGANMFHDLTLPTSMKMALENPYKMQIDLFKLFPNSGGLQWAAQSLGLEPLAGTGHDVKEWFASSNYEAIENHCQDDVRIVKAIHERYM